MSEESAPREGVESVDRALSILLAFREEDEPVTLSTLCQRTGLHKSTVLRLLSSLERAGMLYRLPEKRYRLGPAVVQMGRVFNSVVTLPDVARTPATALMERHDLSVSVYVKRGESRVCVYRADPQDLPRDAVEVGDSRPIDDTATGLVFRRFEHVVSDQADYDAIATYGVYNTGMLSIGYPIFGANDRLVAVLCVSGTGTRLTEDRVPAISLDMRHTAQQIEAALGRPVVVDAQAPSVVAAE